jgi:hypothetical protein
MRTSLTGSFSQDIACRHQLQQASRLDAHWPGDGTTFGCGGHETLSANSVRSCQRLGAPRTALTTPGYTANRRWHAVTSAFRLRPRLDRLAAAHY